MTRCSLAIGLLLGVGLFSHSLTTAASAKTLFSPLTCTTAAQRADFGRLMLCLLVRLILCYLQFFISTHGTAVQTARTHTNKEYLKLKKSHYAKWSLKIFVDIYCQRCLNGIKMNDRRVNVCLHNLSWVFSLETERCFKLYIAYSCLITAHLKWESNLIQHKCAQTVNHLK